MSSFSTLSRALCFLVALLLIGALSDPVPFPNCGQYGQGYNLVKGNPHARLVDPGLSERVLDFSSMYISPDKRYLIPSGMTIDEEVSCDYTSVTTVTKSMVDYVKSLSYDITLGIGIAPFSFSGSLGYKNMREDIYNKSTKHVSAEAVCSVYSVKMDLDWIPLNFTTEVLAAVNALSKNLGSMPMFFQFFDDFGTHMIKSGISGAKFVLDSEFSFQSWQEIQDKGFNIGAGASASLKAFSGCAKFMTKTEKRLAEEYDQTRTTFHESTVGTPPPRDGDWKTWAQGAGKTPVVIQSELKPWDQMMTPLHFRDIPPATLKSLQTSLMKAFALYCSNTPMCSTPMPIYSSCMDLKLAGHKKSGPYSISYLSDPRRNTPWYCLDMEGALPPRDFIALKHPVSNQFLTARDHHKTRCYLPPWADVTHHGVPVDPKTLGIRVGDSGMASATGHMVPFGATYSIGEKCLFHSACWCPNTAVYSLEGTFFSFDGERRYDGHVTNLDAQHQRVQVQGIEGGSLPAAGPYGVSNLKYIAVPK